MNHPHRSTKEDVARPRIPRGLRTVPTASQLATSSAPSQPQRELTELRAEASQIERWWTEARWKHTKRIYSGKTTTRFF